jgi:hypothetical protein
VKRDRNEQTAAKDPDSGSVEQLAQEDAVVIDRLVIGQEHLQIPDHVDDHEPEEDEAADGHHDLAADGRADECVVRHGGGG